MEVLFNKSFAVIHPMGVLFDIKYLKIHQMGSFSTNSFAVIHRWGSFSTTNILTNIEKFTNEVCNVYMAGGGSDEVPNLEIP